MSSYHYAALLVGAAIESYIFPVIGVLIGLAGVAAYLTGSIRKSLSETQARDIVALDHRIETLETENEALRDSDNAKSEALAVLMEQIKGTVELSAIKAEVERVRVQFEDHMARFAYIDNELKFLRQSATKTNRALGAGRKS